MATKIMNFVLCKMYAVWFQFEFPWYIEKNAVSFLVTTIVTMIITV